MDDGFEIASGTYAPTMEVHNEFKQRTIYMPFDSGFGAKSNEMILWLDTPYVLIGSDDFNFGAEGVREGIEKLVHVLETRRHMGIASGRVNDNPYESLLYFEGTKVIERSGYYCTCTTPDGIEYKPCDLTVNFSLIRSHLLGFFKGQLHWDAAAKIGQGEHGAFFVDAYQAGIGVCYVPGVNIDELNPTPEKVDPRYIGYRQRASLPGRSCLVKRGITHWQRADGVEETA